MRGSKELAASKLAKEASPAAVARRFAAGPETEDEDEASWTSPSPAAAPKSSVALVYSRLLMTLN